jgi:hypothetical protein
VFSLKILLRIEILLCVISLGFDYLKLQLIAGFGVAPRAWLDVSQMVVGTLNRLIAIACFVVFLIWFYRVHANLKALGASELKYTSEWAIGYWFVPILQIFRPVQVAQEIWRNSDPDLGVSASSTFIGVWWAFWLNSIFINSMAFQMTSAANTPGAVKDAITVSMFGAVALILTRMMDLAIVSSIDARQEARFDAMQHTVP